MSHHRVDLDRMLTFLLDVRRSSGVSVARSLAFGALTRTHVQGMAQ
jgi:hypothetical protein